MEDFRAASEYWEDEWSGEEQRFTFNEWVSLMGYGYVGD